ncbi:hypothetical protein C4K10_1895 [Pseudomonas chlororaphis subsp. aureofaciens]|uniref:hypothetical protein n=1 Tax=Pseudomonas chlororaphis TaxID=587753 RepID=UPI000F569188|nr:hypothetical protein [Pseudomonas chlororaphis]AZE10185.1 hypothetical protein C4K10_1895 [Pseudomonas chlororaphis subsp. aureofaciens]
MRGLDENSKTKKKSLMYHSSDGLYMGASVRVGRGVEITIGGDELAEYSVELSREEAEELARFILRGL